MIDYIIKEQISPMICSQIFNVEESNIMQYFLKTNFELASEKNEEENNINIIMIYMRMLKWKMKIKMKLIKKMKTQIIK